MHRIETRTAIVLGVLLVLLVGATAPCAAGSIRGRVIDRLSGEPLAGVRVEIPDGSLLGVRGRADHLGVELTVTDTATGEAKTYVDRPGEPFQPILDTRAFGSCP